jgi:hypothetical protein
VKGAINLGGGFVWHTRQDTDEALTADNDV